MKFPNKKYNIIYADPPWEYRQSGGKTNSRGMAKQHYDTMSTEDICALPVPDIIGDNAVLFMWATFPNISEALSVIDAWGFEYKTAAFVWVKKNRKSGTNFWGMGAYTRANAEPCLLGIKNIKAKSFVQRNDIHQIIEYPEVVQAPIRSHSQKPAIVREKIVDLCGGLARIELFAREATDGWDTWGNEVPDEQQGALF